MHELQLERNEEGSVARLVTAIMMERMQGLVPKHQRVWIPLRQTRLPAPMQDVLACNADTQRFWGQVTFRGGLFLADGGRILTGSDVTHWMPTLQLPTPLSLNIEK